MNVTYRVRGDAASIEARARAIAVEQSVEMPVEAIEDPAVLDGIVGTVEAIAPGGEGVFEVRIGLAVDTTGFEIGQLLNMLFGNSSIQDDVTLQDVDFPAALTAAFAGPRHGLGELRRRVGAEGRALTCSALKPQGMSAADLGRLAGRLARGGLDYIKDDHGLADQRYSPFADRVQACAEAVAAAGGRTRYVPSLSGHLDQLREQAETALAAGIDTVLVAPMILGLPSVHALVREFPALAFMAHPAMAGAARIAPPLLLGKIFRLIGADATVFPNHGGRFGYSPETCRALAAAALDPWADYRATVPVPAGGMTLARTAEMLDFYGRDSMLLIGGNLLSARERLVEEAQAFTDAVRRHSYR
ncbi:MAG TPA: RuBisCO large subunit C-terminal-like domain-containing protein [Aliidongia sp.]|nr:RuBisCO large subunit C-terminal-like domain-containing protein [Aliidongia sp.]